jgi:HPt (histidine-containing phosphotransfer) domain-containing protein
MDSPSVDTLDVGALAELAEDLGEAFPDFVHRFLASTARELDAIDAALIAGDGERAATLAHTMRGAAGYLGARVLEARLGAVQGAAQAGDRDGAREHGVQARHALAAVAPLLRARAGSV